MKTTLMQVTGMDQFHLFFAHLKPHVAQGHAIFSPPGEGSRDVIVTMEGTMVD